MTILKIRKKPVEIFAIEWTGNNLREVIDFCGLHQSANKWTWEEYCEVVAKEGLKIFTLEGPLCASVGDFILKGIQGEFYPCKPDILWKTYELVSLINKPICMKTECSDCQKYNISEDCPFGSKP